MVDIDVLKGAFDGERVLEVRGGLVLTVRDNGETDSLVRYNGGRNDVLDLQAKLRACYLDGEDGMGVIVGSGPYRVYYKSKYSPGIDMKRPKFLIKGAKAQPTVLHCFVLNGNQGFAIGFANGDLRFYDDEGKFVRTIHMKYRRKPAVTAIWTVPCHTVSKDAKHPDECLYVQTDMGTSIRLSDPDRPLPHDQLPRGVAD